MCTTRLFVNNLPENTNDKELQAAFSNYGDIINFELKTKSQSENVNKTFAFITLRSSKNDIDSCIKYFSSQDFNGAKLYVTIARESFLERLQRERLEAKNLESKQIEKNIVLPATSNPVIFCENLNPRKKKLLAKDIQNTDNEVVKKKNISDNKRLESLKKKRQEFKQKQMILKSGFMDIDKSQNKKVIFSDNDEPLLFDINSSAINDNDKTEVIKVKKNLFDGDDAEESENEDEINFKIKEQFEGKKGKEVLDLQSRYKSDKRFILDERFVDDDNSFNENEETVREMDLTHDDERSKQLSILQDVLGVQIKSINKTGPSADSKKHKPKLGMLRYDPSHPDHAKFLIPVEKPTDQITMKSKKKKSKDEKEKVQAIEPVQDKKLVEKDEVSKQQFFKVSETLRETISQPVSFSLRNLFSSKEVEHSVDSNNVEDTEEVLPKVTKKDKMKNPLMPDEKNPFIYDSSDSETEETEKILPNDTETKVNWRENFFFCPDDKRLIDGLIFFNKIDQNEVRKERRELKSLMKKRIFNSERKNELFKKKIGGRKKLTKKHNGKRM